MSITIEEVTNKFLLVAGSLGHHLDCEGSQLVLVVRETKLSPVEAGVLSVQGLDPVVHLGLITAFLLHFLRGN